MYMVLFLIFFVGLIITNSLISAKNYRNFSTQYDRLQFFMFDKKFSFLIANENSKNEFIIFSDYNFKTDINSYIQFDIWALVDLHKLYWLLKFNRKINKLGLFKSLNK